MNMKWFHNEGLEVDEASLTKLGERLQELRATQMPALDMAKKQAIRGHLFERIQMIEEAKLVPGADEVESDSYLIDRLTSWIRSVAGQVSLPPVRRALMLERLMSLPERSLGHVAASRGLFRRAAASFSLGGVLAMSVFTYMLRVPVTFAREFTVVHEVVGDAQVLRDGALTPVRPGFELKAGDRLETGADGQVVVKYFDKSFTRLFADAQLDFKTLKSEDFGVDHTVELDLQKGMMWSNVLDLVTNSEFKVKASALTASASKRATFALSADAGTSQLQVFHNLVSVETGSSSVSQTVVNGFQLTAQANGPQGAIVPISLKTDEKAWVSANLQKDEQLIGEAQKDSKGVVAGPGGILQENASLLLAFNPDEKYRLELSVAEKAFYDMMKKSDVKPDEVRGAYSALEGVVTKSKDAQGDDAKKLAAAVLQSARNELLQASPDAGLYDVKVEIENRLLASSDAGAPRLSLALDQASQFLIEAQLFQEKSMKDDTAKALLGYRDRMKLVAKLGGDGHAATPVAAAVPGDDGVSTKKHDLEKMYLAFVSPSPVKIDQNKDNSSVAISSAVDVSEAGIDKPVATVKEVAKEASKDSIKDDARDGTKHDAKTPVSERVTPDVRLPPKLQLSRE